MLFASACVLGGSNPVPPTRPTTDTEAQAMLDETNEFELSDRVFCAAADITNNRVDFDSENEPLKTISMVSLA